MKRSLRLLPVLLLLVGLAPAALAKSPKATEKRFPKAGNAALRTMVAQATALKIQGVAVVAFAPGDAVERWVSAMAVVGHLTDHTNGAKGNNLLAIAYGKVSEMANTLQNSGTSGREPMTGEFGWQGGLIERVPGGYLIVAFSGGKSEDDLATARAGMAVLKAQL